MEAIHLTRNRMPLDISGDGMSRSREDRSDAVVASSALKVLHVYKTFYPDSIGGLELAIAQMVRGTRRLGVVSRIVSTCEGPKPAVGVWESAQHYRYKRNVEIASSPMSVDLALEFGTHLEWADIVHYHFPWPFADLLHSLWRVKKPSIVTYHSDIVRQRNWMRFYEPLMRHFLGRVDRIIATSPNYLRTSGVLRKFEGKTEVIPLGLDQGDVVPPRESVKQRWRNVCGEGFFIFVGVIRYYKGLHILLDAVAGTDLPVVIIGAGPIEDELRQRANRLGLGNVRFLGALPEEDKVALLELAGAVVFPSHLRSEAFGLTLVEGAMFGKALVSSEIGTGTSYINIDGDTGLVVPPGDPVALRAAMTRLATDTELRSRLGRRAQLRFGELFHASVMAEAYARVYRELASSPAPAGLPISVQSP